MLFQPPLLQLDPGSIGGGGVGGVNEGGGQAVGEGGLGQRKLQIPRPWRLQRFVVDTFEAEAHTPGAHRVGAEGPLRGEGERGRLAMEEIGEALVAGWLVYITIST